MTSAGRAALWLLVGWLLAAVALLAAQGRLMSLLAAGVPVSVVALVLRALVRQQRAPSICDRPLVPERYQVADDLADSTGRRNTLRVRGWDGSQWASTG